MKKPSKPRRPRKPWRVLLSRPGGSTRTDYISSQAAYEDVVVEREKAERGETEVTAIRVLQWSDGNWSLYERIAPDHSSAAADAATAVDEGLAKLFVRLGPPPADVEESRP